MAAHWRDNVIPASLVMSIKGVKLLPCPFCGSGAVGLWTHSAPHVTCGNCQADGPAIEGRRIDLEERQHRALQAWNTRAQTQS